MTSRFGLVGAPNARELGGIVTGDGRRVRAGRVFRTGELGRLTDADVATLARLGLSLVIDLRHHTEIALAPPDRLPVQPRPRVLHQPVHDPAHPLFTYLSAVLSGREVEGIGGLRAEGIGGLRAEGSTSAMRELYRWFVAAPAARESFGGALRAIAAARGAPVLVHCSAGKDRTGWLTAVLLGALGVERERVLAEYLSPNGGLSAVRRMVVEGLRTRGVTVDESRILPVLEARDDYLAAAYAEAERRYGDMARFVRDGLGVPDADVKTLRTCLLDGE